MNKEQYNVFDTRSDSLLLTGVPVGTDYNHGKHTKQFQHANKQVMDEVDAKFFAKLKNKYYQNK